MSIYFIRWTAGYTILELKMSPITEIIKHYTQNSGEYVTEMSSEVTPPKKL
jgi:hypothetical protein